MQNENRKVKKKTLPTIYLLGALHLFIGLNATISGLIFMIKPDGSWMGMQPDWLDRSPFQNYFIPGLLLFLFLGISSLVVLYGLFIPPTKWSNFKVHRATHWAWTGSISQGLIIILWIIIQIILTQYFWMQPVILLVGIMIVLLTLTPSVINFYSKGRFD